MIWISKNIKLSLIYDESECVVRDAYKIWIEFRIDRIRFDVCYKRRIHDDRVSESILKYVSHLLHRDARWSIEWTMLKCGFKHCNCENDFLHCSHSSASIKCCHSFCCEHLCYAFAKMFDRFVFRIACIIASINVNGVSAVGDELFLLNRRLHTS